MKGTPNENTASTRRICKIWSAKNNDDSLTGQQHDAVIRQSVQKPVNFSA